MPEKPVPPLPPKPPMPPMPGVASSEQVPVSRPAGDLNPKIKAQIGIGGILAVAAIVAGAVPDIAEALHITLPGVAGMVISIVMLIARGYQKAGDGR